MSSGASGTRGPRGCDSVNAAGHTWVDDPSRPLHVEAIDWNDSSGMSGWQEAGRVKACVHIQSVGWVVHEDDEVVVITTSLGHNRQVLDPLTIPKGCIEFRRRIPHA